MIAKWRLRVGLATLILGVAALWLMAADEKAPGQKERRDAFLKTEQQGNWKDAYEGLRKLALDPADDPVEVGNDLTHGITCLQRLGRDDEIDEFREGVIEAHKGNWRLLDAAAKTYQDGQHQGYIIAGKFSRGWRRAGGRYVGVFQRDRARALQLMQQALPLLKDEKDKAAAGAFHLHFADVILRGAGYYETWRLQSLTDLTQLPDYGEGWGYGGSANGAPVNANGDPIYYKVPKTYEASQSDGERWRWMLMQAAEIDSARANETDILLANFMRGQLGVQTMAQYGRRFRGGDDKEDTSGTYALHTLTDDETIARLATGTKRFKVPDEFNWIKIYERVIGRGKSSFGEQARDALSNEFEDRRQYVKSGDAWQKAIDEYGPGERDWRKQRRQQIVGNWGRFEPGEVQPAGSKATVDFRFRNGKKVAFEARPIDVAKLLDDVKAYLKSNPGTLDGNKTNIGNIGYRLVEQNETAYLGEKAASWDMELKPRPEHVDDRVTVTTPLLKPGAYLLTAQMADGNLSRIIVWLSDTVIVRKQLDGQAFYYVADAVTGQPVAKAGLDFFGWRQVQVKPNTNQYRVETTAFSETSDADGQLTVGAGKLGGNYQWVITARKAKDGQGGADRFAYLGFTWFWFGPTYDAEYNQTRVFTMTDRPVYRPLQTVQFKAWVEHSKYDQPDTSDYAGKSFTVLIHNPRGDKIYEKTLTADEYGGLVGELPLAKDAVLGTYGLQVKEGQVVHGGGSFRVEEYKKPEFEVTVEAPKEPVQLGEPIVATIQAKYYFGAPVVRAKVKYTVTRSTFSSDWHPRGTWDWLYGRGYWWFAADYAWYPGWAEWGTRRPVPFWFRGAWNPPEVVLQNEVEIGPDGVVKVPIDTSIAKALHGNQDHKYTITAEVVDESRRTIVGSGDVLVARKPFRVFAWVDRGHYNAGDTIHASFRAQTLDGKPVVGPGELTLYRITYNEKSEPVEKAVQTWKLETSAEGQAREQIKAAEAGQYRLSYKVTDAKKHTEEGGYLFVVTGEGFDGKDFRFNDVELVADKREYAPGDKVKLLVNTDKADAAVLLFVRPANGIYLAPKVLRLTGKSTQEEVAVVQKDMPNFFVEALTVHGGKVFSELREVVVPPEKRIVNVEVVPSATEYRPGQKATIQVKLTDLAGKPFVGSTVLTVYDRSVEYISGGSNVPEIRAFFWNWRRHHYPSSETNVAQWFPNLLRHTEIGMANLGLFGASVVEELAKKGKGEEKGDRLRTENELFDSDGVGGGFGRRGVADAKAAAPGGPAAGRLGGDNGEQMKRELGADKQGERQPGPGPGVPQPTVRKNFADTAYWSASVATNKDGFAEVTFPMPENLTGWKVKVWAMGHGTKVGQGEAEVVTKKDLLVRLQAPRFFVQKDEVVLSANVHNYLKTQKSVEVTLELDGGTLGALTELKQQLMIPAGRDKRVDWRVQVKSEGQAVVRVKAVTDEESDAMEMRFPCLVHGMLKTDSYSGAIRPDKDLSAISLTVPAERRINESRLEVRYSPTLAGAMVDALPYLVDYPYGCTEQTLNRFLPTVMVQRTLQRMNLNLKEIRDKRTNLNAQEIGDDKERAKGWKRFDRNPVFDEEEVKGMALAGVQALAGMQLGDGGWGWFSGYGEHSWPHTTAVVVHGLQLAKENDVGLPPNMLERGVEWLKGYQAEQIRRIKNAPSKTNPWKEHADETDALVYMVLVDAGVADAEMRDFLYRDRTHLAVYAKAMYGLGLFKLGETEKLSMILKNIDQFVVQDDENQTAYLRLPAGNHWWSWYGSEVESNGYYLKLLARTSPKDEKASRLVKYLLNNRKNSTYWSNTRDTAVCVEAMADYLKASGEDKPDMTVEVWLDGKKMKEEHIDTKNLFTFDNKLVLSGDAIETGKHVVEVRRKGTGPVYFNAYLTNFTLEDFITKAGLEVKVNRKYYKLTRADKEEKVQGSSGQVVGQRAEKYVRTELKNLSVVKSGDLVEVELEIDSKNDYEYLIFEDPKAAGFEAMLVRSGYNGNDMGAYVELRDDRVSFFVRALARGKHSVSYRLRAEIPGKFSALPTRGYAMYAPELKGNSDEIKIGIDD
ncbi:MAG TPA: MG2 domain-containing protein [Gemmataceae bacterium]|nr:MG2 domain-containing protein [Gemmataceae bacterium]